MPAWPLAWPYEGAAESTAHYRHGIAQTSGIRTRSLDTTDRNESYQAIQNDPKLMTIVRQTGRTLFGDNCAACHGFDAKGGKSSKPYNGLLAVGRRSETIAETIRVGINSAHPNTRSGQMLAFGRDRILQPTDVDNVVDYVLSLSDPTASKQIPPARLEAGNATFAANCAACHGDDGGRKTEVGAPDLTDKFWIYGGDARSILASERPAGTHADMESRTQRRRA
jgi:cytochrome c oxidase cbb3-type subunit 3